MKLFIWRDHLINSWTGLLVGFCLLGAGCASTSSSPSLDNSAELSTNIGVVDIQRLLAETSLGKQVNESLKAFMTDRQALIDLEQKELRAKESELLRQGSVLSASAKKQKEEEFRRRMMAYQQKVAELNREVQAKQEALFSEFRTNIESVVARLAKQRGLVIVLEKGPNTPTRYFHPGLDLTDRIIQELK